MTSGATESLTTNFASNQTLFAKLGQRLLGFASEEADNLGLSNNDNRQHRSDIQ